MEKKDRFYKFFIQPLIILMYIVAFFGLFTVCNKPNEKLVPDKKLVPVEEVKIETTSRAPEINKSDSLEARIRLLNENLLIFEKKVKEQSKIIKNNDNKITELEGLVNQTEEECLLCMETLQEKLRIIEDLEYLLLTKDVIDPDDNSSLSSFGSVSISPDGFFRDFIEVVTRTNVTKAVLKNRDGVIIKEFKDPKIINTTSIPPGTYYLSFYNEKGELIQGAKAVCKRQY